MLIYVCCVCVYVTICLVCFFCICVYDISVLFHFRVDFCVFFYVCCTLFFSMCVYVDLNDGSHFGGSHSGSSRYFGPGLLRFHLVGVCVLLALSSACALALSTRVETPHRPSVCFQRGAQAEVVKTFRPWSRLDGWQETQQRTQLAAVVGARDSLHRVRTQRRIRRCCIGSNSSRASFSSSSRLFCIRYPDERQGSLWWVSGRQEAVQGQWHLPACSPGKRSSAWSAAVRCTERCLVLPEVPKPIVPHQYYWSPVGVRQMLHACKSKLQMLLRSMWEEVVE